MTRILIIGEAVAPTGFTRVIRSIFEPLARDFELHQLATRYDGRGHDYPWMLHRADAGSGPYGYDRVAALVDELRPDVVFILYDLVFQVRYVEELRKATHRPAIVVYSPVESGPVSPELMRGLGGLGDQGDPGSSLCMTRYVTYTQYGRSEIEAALAGVVREQPSFEFPALDVIPHGVDTHRFRPLGSSPDHRQRRIDARKAMGMTRIDHLDAFIVLNANRNMPRKRIDLTMQGFAQFARDKPPNVLLYLHMATEDTGWNVLILARRYGIYDRLVMTRADNVRPDVPDARLNLVYNACDVGLTTTTGEGWGMVAFEHAATGAAQVMPRHTSLAELWDGAAEFIEPEWTMTWPGNLTEGHVVTAEGVAAALERVYVDEARRTDLARRAHENATRDDYRWDAIARRWKALLEDAARAAQRPSLRSTQPAASAPGAATPGTARS